MKEDLSEAVIEKTQTEAQAIIIMEELMLLRSALQNSDEYDRLDSLEIPMAEDAYRRARERYDEIRFRLSVKPSVVVVGAKKDAI